VPGSRDDQPDQEQHDDRDQESLSAAALTSPAGADLVALIVVILPHGFAAYPIPPSYQGAILLYQFTGYDRRTYPDFVVDGAVLVVDPGDVRELDGEVPGDGFWVPVKPEPVKSPKQAAVKER
jgi:hypothetical protein